MGIFVPDITKPTGLLKILADRRRAFHQKIDRAAKAVPKPVVATPPEPAPVEIVPPESTKLENIIAVSYPPAYPSVATIQRAVCDHWHITKNDLICQRREPRLVRPRFLAVALCRELTPLSYPQIGRCFHNRDHTTMLHSCRKMSPIMDKARVALGEGAPLTNWVELCTLLMHQTGFGSRRGVPCEAPKLPA
jgi:hypothetical protein